MFSETSFKKMAAACTVISIVIIVFSCYGFILLFDRHIDSEVIFFGAFSILSVSALTILITLLTRKTREALEDEVTFLRNRIMELEKVVNKK
ncbi:hypothetical protein [Paenibacillus paeoniae]|uniref:DUF2304 domain-containing protein n=1 Tax=Paenibacillus paeoniae TaxID=2292705 RepID=A0A371PGR4_9BACL|nr:hypothetical protein [Paenibacillus paeoniae]REK75034.1 hypothetical protein DX130_15470 [Paenibacillus paeoniae]